MLESEELVPPKVPTFITDPKFDWTERLDSEAAKKRVVTLIQTGACRAVDEDHWAMYPGNRPSSFFDKT